MFMWHDIVEGNAPLLIIDSFALLIIAMLWYSNRISPYSSKTIHQIDDEIAEIETKKII